MKNWMRLLVSMGCGLRLLHYLRDPSVWHDEGNLIVNVLRLDFAQLLGPLLWNGNGPPLFLWLERAVALALGDSSLALRLVPMLASCGTLVLLSASAQRWLPPRGAFCAVLLIAVSDRLLWHSCEAKPYSTDVFVASLLMFIVSFTDHWTTSRRIFLLMVLTPALVFLSYPACFVCGGLWLSLLPAAWNSQQRRDRWLHAIWAIVSTGAIVALYFGPIRSQRTGAMESCWVGHFPNWSKPWIVPVWSIANTVETFRYSFKPFGSFLAAVALIGGYQFRHRREFAWLTFLVAALGLAWIAACLGAYPYGGSRLEVYAAPALAMLIGAGIDPLRDGFVRRSLWGLGYPITIVILIGLTLNTAICAVHPWPRADAAGAAAYVIARRQPSEPVVTNHWEYDYYFRNCPHFFLEQQPPATFGREWFVITAIDKRVRAELLKDVTRQGRIIERRDFAMTTAILLDLGDAGVAQR